MPGLNERFLDRENFYIAFKKVSYFLNQGNEWFDQILLAEYEATLPSHIQRLIDEIQNNTYSPKAIQPLPFPKRNRDNGKSRIRPYFNIHLDTQVIWVAILNVISELVEEKMPFWSYGNRLYRPIWFEEEDGENKLKKGSYHNASPHVYRKWNQSWPLYKRHASLTIKTISRNSIFKKEDIDDDKELNIFEQSENINFSDCKYLNNEFWKQTSEHRVFWAGLDMEKFFPSINPQKILENLKICLVKTNGEARDDYNMIFNTMEILLTVPIDLTGWIFKDLSGKDAFALKDEHSFSGIPTGLVAGGFLANLAMLDVDIEIDHYIQERRSIAVFKYVDDHIILSQSQQGLIEFLNYYHNLLKEKHNTINFQIEKTEPSGVFNYKKESGFRIIKKYERFLELDVDFPSPLMTDTLKKVSHIGNIEFELLEDKEIEDLEVDIRHLLVTDFPPTEIRKDTKMSFAAGKLCKLATQIKPNFSRVDFSLSGNMEKINELYLQEYELKKNKEPKTEFAKKNFHNKLRDHAKNSFVRENLTIEITAVGKRHKKIFNLLIKTLKDNPDKVQLWKKSIEFCMRTGYQGMKVLIDTIEKCEIHKRSKTFLKIYCLQTIQISLSKAVSELNSEDILFWRVYCLSSFINDISELKYHLSNAELAYPFAKKTNINFLAFKDFIDNEMISEEITLSQYNMQFFTKKSKNLTKIIPTENYPEDLIWFFSSRYSWEGKKVFLERVASTIDLSKRISWSILSISPELIPAETVLRITEYIPQKEIAIDLPYSEMSNLVFENGFSYEMLNSLFRKNKLEYQKIAPFYPTIDRKLNRKEDMFISLDEWLQLVLEQNKINKWLDPRLSEWTLLEIVRRISILITNELTTNEVWESPFNKIEYNFIHPTNYLIPKSWAVDKKMTWSDWQEIIKKDNIKFADKDSLIDDYRFFPASKMWKNHIVIFFGNGDIPLIMGLSVLLVKLISKRLDWPPAANKLVFIDKLFNNIYLMIEQENFSSDLRILLNAIFSKSDFDMFTQFDKIQFGKDEIQTVGQFGSYLIRIQEKLSKAQFHMTDKEPRQLVYVDIDDLNNSKEKYFNEL